MNTMNCSSSLHNLTTKYLNARITCNNSYISLYIPWIRLTFFIAPSSDNGTNVDDSSSDEEDAHGNGANGGPTEDHYALLVKVRILVT